jgi:CBS domain-containing protein
MTKDVQTVRDNETLRNAAKKMRDHNIGDVVVLDRTDRLKGILTDRDIVVRAIALGYDPAVTTAGEVATADIQTMKPDERVVDAVECMRKKAVRRVPVVDDGKVVGILSLGDLAQARDSNSALGQISAAPPNN